MAKYRCKHCGMTATRNSKKKWVKSYCATAKKDVHLMRVDKKEVKSGS